MRNNEKAAAGTSEWWFLIACILVILFSFLIGSAVLRKIDNTRDLQWAANYSTAMGIVGTFSSTFALIGVILTLRFAKQQVLLLREQIDKASEDAFVQSEQTVAQQALAYRQSVQSQFFQMLASWQSVTHNVGMQTKVGTLTGNAALGDFGRRISRAKVVGEHDDDTLRDMLTRNYETTTNEVAIELGHYFRLLYHIVRFVDLNPVLSMEEKRDLIRIVRAHLSDPELVLLFHNGLHRWGAKMYSLIERYDLLQNMPHTDLQDPTWMRFYPDTDLRRKRDLAAGRAL